ncbi:hypothetical protein GGR56DRAFT_673262 [Xylariaceae sp. FL0804]|nr:hypothetical protein GGR56DRAFT_673262 [Xylariaceae sp. FL0804]
MPNRRYYGPSRLYSPYGPRRRRTIQMVAVWVVLLALLFLLISWATSRDAEAAGHHGRMLQNKGKGRGKGPDGKANLPPTWLLSEKEEEEDGWFSTALPRSAPPPLPVTGSGFRPQEHVQDVPQLAAAAAASAAATAADDGRRRLSTGR